MTPKHLVHDAVLLGFTIGYCRQHLKASHHEASSQAGLEDAIKGTLGVFAVFKGEHLLYVVQAALVVSCAHYCYIHLQADVGWFVAHSAGRIKDILPQIDRFTELLWIAGVEHFVLSLIRSMSLTEKEKEKCSLYEMLYDIGHFWFY